MTLLNEADAIYIGDTPADRVYLGANLVWEPSGGSGPWTPHEIETAMWGWWDASIPSSLTWSGIYLLEIAGQGPGGLHMGRAAGSGPTATTINGLGALAITYDQGLMTPSATTFNDFTIFAVWNPGFSDGSTYERIVDHSYAAGWWFGRTGGTATFGGGIMEGPEVGYGIFVPLANNEVHLISNVREGGDHRISGNGGAVANSRAIHTSPTASNRVYMGQDNVGTSDMTDGKIGEVIIWNRALSTDEMAKTEGYLAHKWGIQAKLPAGHPYKATPPMLGGPGPTAPDDWLLTTFVPGAARNDFTGQVGVRYGIAGADVTVTWLGTFCGMGSGTRTVHICEWFTDTLLRTVTVDMAGQTIGTWVWTAIEPLTLLANGYYSVLQETTASDGLNWSNADVNAIAVGSAETSNVYSCYRVPGGAHQANTYNAMYVGLDLGWNT